MNLQKAVLPIVLVATVLSIAGLEQLRAGSGSPSPGAPAQAPGTGSSLRGPAAPEFQGIAGYINTGPNLTLESLRGRVVLVDFWTYSCINCQRTLPYLKAWDVQYRDRGLTIVGVHTPEFAFEKSTANVKKFVEENDIRYPVVQDNDYATWRAYRNNYWPRKYLVDAEGAIRYDHIGEGGYEETEQQIRELLAERDASMPMNASPVAPPDAPKVDYGRIRTGEIYLGYGFARAPLASPEKSVPGQVVNYTLPASQPPNQVALEGSWRSDPDHAELVSDSGRVVLRYSAKSANIVAGGNATVEVRLDGQPVPAGSRGADVKSGASVAVRDETLYNVVSTPDYGEGLLELRVRGPGFRLYTFTFG